MLALRFVVGRVARRLLRAPVVEGWMADESDAPAKRIACALRKLPDGRLGLAAPGAEDLSLSAEAAAALAAAAEDTLVLIGWPETVFVLRHAGTVVYGEGDVVHFGDLTLDPQRVLRRVGFDYLLEGMADVRVHVQLEERSAIDPARALRRLGFDAGAERVAAVPAVAPVEAGPALDTIRLAPGQRARFGPYELVNERSYDHERRSIAGQRGHAYVFRLRRLGEDPVAPRSPGLPDVLAVASAEELIAHARAAGLLDEDEVLAGEAALLPERLACYEGPRAALEQALAAEGPPRLVWRGDVLQAVSARLARAPDGSAHVGRAVVVLAPAGAPQVGRGPTRALPGRLRRLTRPPSAAGQ